MKRFVHGRPFDDRRSQSFDRIADLGFDLALAVKRSSERIDHSPDQTFTHRNRQCSFGPLHHITFLNRVPFAQNYDTGLVFFQIQSQSEDLAPFKFHQFEILDIPEAVRLNNIIPGFDHGSDLVHFRLDLLFL